TTPGCWSRGGCGSGWAGGCGPRLTGLRTARWAMLDLLLIPIALVYLLVVALLFAFGINFFYLSLVAWRSRAQPLEAPPMTAWPPVTVQLPIYNELYVAQRLIEAAARLDYP